MPFNYWKYFKYVTFSFALPCLGRCNCDLGRSWWAFWPDYGICEHPVPSYLHHSCANYNNPRGISHLPASTSKWKIMSALCFHRTFNIGVDLQKTGAYCVPLKLTHEWSWPCLPTWVYPGLLPQSVQQQHCAGDASKFSFYYAQKKKSCDF